MSFYLETQKQADIDTIWRRYKKSPSDALRNKLIEHYFPTVVRHAQKLHDTLPSSVDFGDLITPGVTGLINAIEGFDPNHGAYFTTYASMRIRGAMLDELRKFDWAPRLTRSTAKQLERATAAFAQEYGRTPHDNELAEFMDLSERQFQKIQRRGRLRSLDSLNTKKLENDNGDPITLAASRCDPNASDPSDRLRGFDALRLATRDCNKQERLVLILYYYDQLTMKRIGETLGLSESRVSQMHSAIIKRLRNRLSERKQEFVA